ncbi:hypothetical protein CERSUDRAFT_163303 [Gelatoporia subvermispora B]|uniref:AB hydrolase-1 domain-containing protein n=1 Tax=Ceriporiopsis subvermispora (strain B) TaxID=914234 RepID=M2P7B1_CERS8|nr:hypothetical protein CERSUDRAFT_163303 [Gelatoporia subvermispora B]
MAHSSSSRNFTTAIVELPSPGSNIPGLRAFAKRYTPLKGDSASNSGLTLMFTHCVGSHKEAWEPIISSLFNLRLPKDSLVGDKVPVIREAWSLEWQGHGDSSVVNHDILERVPPLSVLEWVIVIRHFAVSKLQEGHHLIGIGHSAGAGAILLSTVHLSTGSPIPYHGIILVEDCLATRPVWATGRIQDDLDAMTVAIDRRRDLWPDRQKAREYLSKRFPWMLWDARMFELFMRHGLRDTSHSGTPMVTLSCTKAQEKATYADNGNEPYKKATDCLAALPPDFEVHCIYGEREDIIKEYLHASVIGCRKMTSVHRVPNAGHQVIQENPDAVSLYLGNVLCNIAGRPRKSKL